MPLTYEGSYGIRFECTESKKRISKKQQLQERAQKAAARRAGWDDEAHDKAMRGEIARAAYGLIDLENYLHGIDEPVLLEQDAVPFDLPHVNRAAVTAWERDITALKQSIADVPRSVRGDAFALAQHNYNIHWQRNNPAGDTPPDYIGDFLEDGANACAPLTEEATEFIEFLNMLNIANNEADIAELRAMNVKVKGFCEACGLDAAELGRTMRAIDARNTLIDAVSR